jgi:hypothetical protein
MKRGKSPERKIYDENGNVDCYFTETQAVSARSEQH